MSDRVRHDYKYTAVRIHDEDDDLLIDNSGKSTKSMCCLCWIISKVSRGISRWKQWICGKIPFLRRNDDVDLYRKCLFKAMCWTFGLTFCNRYCIGLCVLLYGCFTRPIRCIYFHFYKSHQVESIESQHRSQCDVERLKEECRSLNARLSDSETEVNSLEAKLEEERREKENALKSLAEERREKERALTRLSAVAGDKLRLNNPGIADLSDENRPNKLAEKFSELYDNEWTEVFEVLEEENFPEEIIIETLLKLLKEIYVSCLQIAKNQRDSLIEDIAKPSRSKVQSEASTEGIMSKVIDLQKQTASVAFSDVKNTLLQMKAMSQFTDNKVKQKYMERCVQLCWMMSIQDPPMMLDFGPAENEVVDKNIFRMYTKQGDKVDFIVWPAVFLHENGPLVQKGVLQPKVMN